MNLIELKLRAVELEDALKTGAVYNSDIAELANHLPLVSAIARAKAGQIIEVEKIPGLYHWSFESDIFWKHKTLGAVFSRFTLYLEGIQV